VKRSRCKDGVLICTNVMKIWLGPKTCLQLGLFEKAFPSSCQAQIMRTQML
jgi:hypothetical protein